MSRTMARTVAAALLLSALAVPLTAQPRSEKASSLSLLARLWQRIAAPVAALFTADDSDGRGGWDPDGLSSDGRSGWDPNG